MINIMSLDVGLCNTGIAVIRLDSELTLIHTDNIKTETEHKKRGIYKTDDTLRRIGIILEGMLETAREFQPKAMVAELPVGGGQSASACEAMGIAKAVCACFSHLMELPLFNVKPDDVKMVAAGRRNASKVEVQDAVSNWYPELRRDKRWRNRKRRVWVGKFEHVADAIAAFYVVKDHPSIKILQVK